MATERDFITPAGLTVTETANVVGNTTSVDMFSNTQRSTTLPSFSQNFKLSKSIDPRFIFTRSSTATYVAANGLIAYANVNIPRFDHDPTTGACMGLLLEESRANQFYPSTPTIVGSGWVGYNSSFNGATLLNYSIAQGYTAPDGSNTASFMYRTTPIYNNDTFYPLNVASIANNVSYTQSIFLKANTTPQEFTFYWGHYNSTESNENLSVYWYPGNNYIVGNASGNVYFTAPPAIQDFRDGWKRIYFTFRYTAATPSIQYKHKLFGNTNVTPDTIGINGSGIYMWGAQLESQSGLNNATFPTSVIPTTTVPIIRSQEMLYTDNTSDIISSDAMTIVCKAASFAYTGNGAISGETRYDVLWTLSSPSTANGTLDYTWMRKLQSSSPNFYSAYYLQYTTMNYPGGSNVSDYYNGFNMNVPTGGPSQYVSNVAYYTTVGVLCSNNYNLFAGGNSSVQSSIAAANFANSRVLTPQMTRFAIGAVTPVYGGTTNAYIGSLAIYRRVFSNTEILNTISNS